MKKVVTNFIYLICFFFTISVIGQKNKQVKDSSKLLTPYSELLEKNRKTIFFMLHRAWLANKPISYLGILPNHSSIGERKVELEKGEGKRGNGFSLFEAKISLEYPLIYGKSAYGSPREKLNQITFDYETIFRMTLDDSFPLTTPNQDVGFSWKFNLFNSHSGYIFNQGNALSADSKYNVEKINKPITFYNFRTSLRHYSNGQSGLPDYIDDVSGKKRNNYIDGNFSTNYIAFELTRGIYVSNSKELHQISLSYRLDGGVGGALSFEPKQNKAFGTNRIGLKYDFREGMYKNKVHKNYYWHIRTELEYIAGNLDNFKANLINDNKKYRLSGSFVAELSPLTQRYFGIVFRAFYGRDYLNIRYDDIIFSAMLGITLDLQKYFVPKIY